jgi:hypothetical protein
MSPAVFADGSSLVKTGRNLVLAAALAATAPVASIAEPYGYGNCYSAGCFGSCPAGYDARLQTTFACGGPFATRTYCCEPLGAISQAQKRKSRNSATAIKAPPRAASVHTPNYTSSKVIKADRATSMRTPKHQFSNKFPTSAKVKKARAQPVSGYTPKNQFPKLYGSPLR